MFRATYTSVRVKFQRSNFSMENLWAIISPQNIEVTVTSTFPRFCSNNLYENAINQSKTTEPWFSFRINLFCFNEFCQYYGIVKLNITWLGNCYLLVVSSWTVIWKLLNMWMKTLLNCTFNARKWQENIFFKTLEKENFLYWSQCFLE